jgi:acetylornithine deacetylase/succinyl-diaminopimelate desuccinylase-like protein
MTCKSSPSKPTVLIYGHMDKQPPLTEFWREGLHPYNPVIQDGKVTTLFCFNQFIFFFFFNFQLYGRGGADDGYSIFSAITSIKAAQIQNVPLPNVIIMIESREESGSQDLPFYVDELKDQIGSPTLVICLDSGCANYDQFWMTSSLRGLIDCNTNHQS